MKLHIIYNDIIPFKGFKGMTILAWLFVRNGVRLTDVDINHETIHCNQQIEMLAPALLLTVSMELLGCGWWSLLAMPLYYWWYLIEWVIRMICGASSHKAYRSLFVEREAYDHQSESDYIEKRKHFAWITYMFN